MTLASCRYMREGEKKDQLQTMLEGGKPIKLDFKEYNWAVNKKENACD